jgi:hypothetical protein
LKSAYGCRVVPVAAPYDVFHPQSDLWARPYDGRLGSRMLVAAKVRIREENWVREVRTGSILTLPERDIRTEPCTLLRRSRSSGAHNYRATRRTMKQCESFQNNACNLQIVRCFCKSARGCIIETAIGGAIDYANAENNRQIPHNRSVIAGHRPKFKRLPVLRSRFQSVSMPIGTINR